MKVRRLPGIDACQSVHAAPKKPPDLKALFMQRYAQGAQQRDSALGNEAAVSLARQSWAAQYGPAIKDHDRNRQRDLQDLLLEEQQIMDTWTKETKEWQASLIEHKDSASA